MKIAELYAFLDKLSPFESQETWDNSGLLLGNLNDEVSEIYLSLDMDENLIDKALPNSLFITHHPLIFKPLRDLANEEYPKNLLKKMLQKNLSLISLHTNYDKSHLNAYFTEQILGFKVEKQEEFLIYVKINLSFEELVNLLKEKLKLPHIHATFSGKNIKEKLGEIAICTGSAGDLISKVKAPCFLTGDIKYHQTLEALNNGISLIDIKHYESEVCFANSLAKNLQNLPIKVIISASKNPFQYF